MSSTARQQYGYENYWERQLPCGHWVFIQPNNVPDGCPRCVKYEMRDEKDRHPWQGKRSDSTSN